MKQEKKNGIPHTNIEGFGNKIQLEITLPRNCIIIDGEIYLYCDTHCDDGDKICGTCALEGQCDDGMSPAMMPCKLFGDDADKRHFVKFNPEEL